MPVERRLIQFSKEEFAHAIVSYARAQRAFLPEGRVCGLDLGGGPDNNEAKVTILVDVSDSSDPRSVHVDAGMDDILNLLILCCSENNIPLPRKGTKKAVVIGETIALMISYKWEAVSAE